jgi:chitinase
MYAPSQRRAVSVSAILVVVGLIAGCSSKRTSAAGEPRRSATTSPWISAYYVGYQRDLYPPDEVDFASISHLMVGRIRPLVDGRVTTDFDIDPTNGPAMARMLSARAHEARRKAILMLGGDGEHAGFVGAASAVNRPRFVSSLIEAVDTLAYDGLDIDWEPIEAADRSSLLALLRDLRSARPSLILTIPVGFVNPYRESVDRWYATLAAEVDQMNVMTYGMAGPWNLWRSWHSSALRGEGFTTPTSVARITESYFAAGVPAAKLGVGIAFYGSCWQGVTGPRQSITSAAILASDNTMSYANLMAYYYNSGSRRWDDAAQVPYLSYEQPYRRVGAPSGMPRCSFVSYEDEQSIAAKGAYVRAEGLGGAIIWTVNQGHFATAPVGSRDPLLAAARDALFR